MSLEAAHYARLKARNERLIGLVRLKAEKIMAEVALEALKRKLDQER